MRRFDVGRAGRWRRFDAAESFSESELIDGLDELTFAAGAHGNGLDDWHTESVFKGGAVDTIAALLGHVAHVERDQHRPTDAFQLENQPQVQAQVSRIDHADQQIGRGLGRMAAQNHVTRNRLIERRRFEAVGAG